VNLSAKYFTVNPPDRFRDLLNEPGFIVMPAVWDGLSAKLASAAGFETAFLSDSPASRPVREVVTAIVSTIRCFRVSTVERNGTREPH